MKIKFDSGLKLVGIGLSPWPRLGPEEWFENYSIASFYDWDVDTSQLPQLISISGSGQTLRKKNTQGLLDNENFQKVLANNFQTYNALTYKPTTLKIPHILNQSNINFLGSKSSLSFENKAIFRNKFKGILPIPDFKIYEPDSLLHNPNILKGNDAVVVQHETLSGGKGTFIVKNSQQTEDSLKYLLSKKRKKKLIVSEYIESGLERSLQCCVTRYGTFVGPLQTQLISVPELQNPGSYSNKFCGAEISATDSAQSLYAEMSQYCKVIGKALASNGYRGIFGVDFLVSPQGRVYVLEVNQRITGVTPLLSMIYRPQQDIPFYLLHILEQGNFQYSITDFDINSSAPEGSMMILHSHKSYPAQVIENIKSGLYSDDLNYTSREYKLRNTINNQILAQRYAPIGAAINEGSRLAVAFSRKTNINSSGGLNPAAKKIVKQFYSNIKLKPIT